MTNKDCTQFLSEQHMCLLSLRSLKARYEKPWFIGDLRAILTRRFAVHQTKNKLQTRTEICVFEFNVRSIALLKYITPLSTRGTWETNRNRQLSLLLKLFQRERWTKKKKKKRNDDNFVSYDKDLFNKQLINYTSYAFSNTILICHSWNVLKILIGKK